MPRLFTLPGADQWTAPDFKADFSDATFGFLGTFEEVLPEGEPAEMKKKKKKGKTTEASTTPSVTKEVEKTEGAKKIKSKKGKKTKKENIEEAKPTSKKSKSADTKKKPAPKNKVEHTATEGEAEKTDEERLVAKRMKAARKRRLLRERKREREAKQAQKELDAEGPAQKRVRFEKEMEASFNSNEKRISIDDSDMEDTEGETETEGTDMSAWSEFHLPEELMNALKSLEFTTPTEIQRLVLQPAVRDRLDILGAAETGSGKTLAFALPVLNRMLNENRYGRGPRALVIAPTRELAMQIMKTFEALLKFLPFKVTSVIGGLAAVKQLRVTSEDLPEVLIATPGRLWDLMQKAEPETYLGEWSGVQCVVVDETDRMVEQGHFEELTKILDTVRSTSKACSDGKMQTLVFSATLTYVLPEKPLRPGETRTKRKELTPKEKIKYLIEATGLRPQKHRVIDVTREFGTAEKLVETRINCSGLLDKDTYIVYLLKRYAGRTLIFTNSVDASRRLYGILNLLQMKPMMIHANMLQRQRLRNLERFAAEENSILLATDVAARGLDIKGIEHVIHYQVPKTAETYIHRSGRTARASQSGLTVLMVDPKDAHLYRKICGNLNRAEDLPVFPIDAEKLRAALEPRVKLASDIDTLQHRAKKIKLNETWFEKAAREADLDLDDRAKERDNASDEMSDLLRKQDRLRAELRMECATPLPDVQKMNLPKTRYITPAILDQYSKSVSTHALDNLEAQLEEMKNIKKRNRGAIKTHNIKGRKFKKKH